MPKLPKFRSRREAMQYLASRSVITIPAGKPRRVKRNPSRKFAARTKRMRRSARGRTRLALATLRPVARIGIKTGFLAQVKRAGRWITLGAFNTKQMAASYGQVLADRYRRKQFRVFWPDAAPKSNPIGDRPGRASPRRVTLSAEGEQAARLLESFTGSATRRLRRVKVPRPKAALALGPLHAVIYSTTRDGKRERYMHEFRREARPLLAASHDGRSLYLLGGAYRFTDRGIVDR